MTLATVLVAVDPVNPEDVWHLATVLVGGNPNSVVVSRKPGSIYNQLGQGLDAIVDVDFAVDGPLYWPEDPDSPYYEEWESSGPHCVRLSLDTAYGYKAPNGASCDDLHAWVVATVGAALDARGVRWRWQNEYDSSWHDGAEGLSSLGDPVRGALVRTPV